MTIQERILNLLEENRRQQKELAAYISVSYSTLNSWLRRNRDIPAQYVIRICRFLNCTPEYLIEGEDNPGQNTPTITRLSDEALRMAAVWDTLDVAGKAITLGEVYRRAELIVRPSEEQSGKPWNQAK